MKRTLLILLTMLTLSSMFAVPASPLMTTFTQTDGSSLDIFVRGDELLNWTETRDGYTLLEKNKNKYYAIKDIKGDLVVSDVIAKNPENRSQKEKAFLNTITPNLYYSESQVNLANQIRSERLGGFPTTGEHDFLVILANFSDTTPTYSQTNFDNMMNQTNYNGIGSFKEYYLEVSYGQLTLNATVIGWVQVPNSHDYYGPEHRWAEFARDAVYAADPLVDYSQFDNNGDNRVEGVAIYHQGRGQETTGDTSDIWSHSYSLVGGGYFVNLDGVQISEYTMQAERQYWSMAGIGVICHEFGHNLGTPDFYDTDYATGGQQDGTGEWDIMGSGAYNGNGDRPAHHNIWTKNYFGWIELQELYDDGPVTLLNSTENPAGYYLTTPVNNETIMLDNIKKSGFNASVPGAGMLVYHADGNWIQSHLNSNNINTTSHQGFYIVPAGGYVDSYSAPFPTSYINSITDTTNPALPTWGQFDISKEISDIQLTNDMISFNFVNNSAYIPQITFSQFTNNSFYHVGDDINLDLTINSSIYQPDMVEIMINDVTLVVHTSQPYDYSGEITGDMINNLVDFEANTLTVKLFSGNIEHRYDYTFNVIDEDLPFLDQFDTYDDFALTFGEWELIDNDDQETISLPFFEYPNAGAPQSFMIFNPDMTTPYNRDIIPFSGSKVALTFSNESDVANDDWMISPVIDATIADPHFYELHVMIAGSQESGELVNILYATSLDDYAEFTPLNESPIEAEENWIPYTFPLDNEVTDIKIAVQVVSEGGKFVMVDDVLLVKSVVVSNQDNDVSQIQAISANNYPNPFNPETTIQFNLQKPGQTSVVVYNLKGQKVINLLNENLTAGQHSLVWNGRDQENKAVASGIYLYQVKSGNKSIKRKMILQK